MGNNKEVNIEFSVLNGYIKSMKSLLDDMDEPSYDKMQFWTSGASGSGYVHDNLISFTNNTIDYHASVSKLIQKTIEYLENVGGVKEADEKLADAMK